MMKAMFSGVAGLRANQTGMDVIGNNVSNVNTNGFKASRTVYRDMLYSTLTGASGSTNVSGGNNPSQIGCGSQVSSIDVINSNGGRVTTDRSLDTYIDGEGYLAVSDGAGNTVYSRLGRLDFDSDGNLVDGNNRFVMGYAPKDSQYLAYIDGAKVDLHKETDENAKYLDGFTIKVEYDKSVSSDTIAADRTNKTITIKTKKVDTDGKSTFTRGDLQTALQKLGDGTWTNDTADEDRDGDGTKETLKTLIATIDGNITVDGDTAKIVNMTNGKISETTLCDTTADPKKINYADINSLTSLSVDATGTITGTDKTSGKAVVIGQLAIATFSNPNALTQMGSSYYAVSSNSGTPNYQAAGVGAAGKIVASALEGSNVDLANEFSNMILTQRGFQANSKIITVTDTMLEELVNLKR